MKCHDSDLIIIFSALELEEKAVVFEDYCTACGACIEMCPVVALALLPEQ